MSEHAILKMFIVLARHIIDALVEDCTQILERNTYSQSA